MNWLSKKIAFIVTLFILSTVARFAQSETVEIKLEPSFEFLENGFRLKKKWALETSPTLNLGLGIYSLGFTNSTCTGTLISNEGHILIARHCLEPVIGISENIRKSRNHLKPLQTVTQQGELSIIQFDSSYLSQSLTVPVGLGDSLLYAKIFVIGPGYLTPRFSDAISNDSVRVLHDSLSDQGFSSGGDFAIVQLDELKGQKCYKLSARAAEVGDIVKATRFTCYQTDSQPWPTQVEEKVIVTTEAAGIQNWIYIPRGSIVTSGSGVDCNSGSAVRNYNDEIVGVFHSAVPFGTPSGRTYRALIISTNRILELIPKTQRREIVKLNASCG